MGARGHDQLLGRLGVQRGQLRQLVDRQVGQVVARLDRLFRQLAGNLAEKGIKTRDDLADLAVDELSEMTALDAEAAKKLIMAARAHWFGGDDKKEAA